MIARASRLMGKLRLDWRHSCNAGSPVPDAHRCTALHCASVPLLELREGDCGTVSCLQEPGSLAVQRLSAFGVLPGVEVALVQRFPAFVLRVGHAELAMDAAMADHVRVLRDR
jgi:DtxR family transcriptional regulator, Mn-dependent transcriptional regulator